MLRNDQPDAMTPPAAKSARAKRLARAEARRRVALGVVEELRLLDHWRPYGEPVLVGSVPLDLVVRPDIDLDIYADAPAVRHGFEVVAALAELPKVRSCSYLDLRDSGEGGLYWKVDYELTPEETWTIDMCLFASDRPGPIAAPLTRAVGAALTDDLRDTILRIKEEAMSVGQRAHSPWLYQAVFQGVARNYADYVAWLGDQDVYERSGWLPTPP
ncbi:hypothetical protein [Actinopolymorpha pittospori]